MRGVASVLICFILSGGATHAETLMGAMLSRL